MIEVSFSAKKKESRYEETIPDRPTTRGAAVPPVGPRRESQHPDDLSHGRGGGASARRSRPPAARGRIGVDAPGHGGGSSAPGRRASSTAPRAARAALGERKWLLRGGRAEGTDSENPFAQPGPSRATAGQLRTVPAQWTDGTRGMGQDDARAVDAQLWSGGERLSRSLRGGEVGGKRQLHRLQPGKVAGVDGASAGRVTVVRGADRRHAVSRPADDRGPGDQC